LSSAVAKLVVQEKLVNMSDQMFYGNSRCHSSPAKISDDFFNIDF
jgi:hypothetical protein